MDCGSPLPLSRSGSLLPGANHLPLNSPLSPSLSAPLPPPRLCVPAPHLPPSRSTSLS